VAKEDPAVSKLIDAILFGLDQITTDNGFYNTIAETTDIIQVPGDGMNQFPFVVLHVGDDESANKNLGSRTSNGQNMELLHNSFDIMFETYSICEDVPRKEAQKQIADLQEYFGKNFHLPDSLGISRTFNMIYSRSGFRSLKTNVPNLISLTEFRVWYRILSTDPTKLG